MNNNADNRQVIVTGIQMPFGSMVAFMMKWMLATVVAILVPAFLVGLVTAIVVPGLERAARAGQRVTVPPPDDSDFRPYVRPSDTLAQPENPNFRPDLPTSPFRKPFRRQDSHKW
jgi:hypothetical protein